MEITPEMTMSLSIKTLYCMNKYAYPESRLFVVREGDVTKPSEVGVVKGGGGVGSQSRG